MTQIFTGSGLGTQGSSLGLGSYGPKGVAALGQGDESVYVNAATGNLVVQQNDGFLADMGLGLNLFQTYNSKGDNNSSWRFNVQANIEVQGTINTAGSTVIRTSGDGHRTFFHYDTNKQMYLPDEGGTERITFNQNQWVYKKGSSQSMECYNQAGQLIKMTDKDGHYFSFSYNQGQLTSITSHNEKQTVTWSFSQGLLTDVTTSSDGQMIHHLHYEYNEFHQVQKVSRDLGQGKAYWITYDYVPGTQLISNIKQSDGTSLHIDYDAQGRVKQLIDGEGRTSVYTYEEGKTQVTNDLGETWTYYYDEKNRLTGVDGPEQYRIRYNYEGNQLSSVVQGSEVWHFAYNEQGDCIRIDEPSGQITHRVFDAEHRLILETNYQNFDGTHHPIDPCTTRYIYDEQGHLLFAIASNGTVTEHRYDNEGQRISSRTYLHTAYNLKDVAPDTILSKEALIDWIKLQNPQKISLVGYAYDWRGQLIEEIHYASVNAQGQGLSNEALLTHYRYDAAGRLVEKSVPTEKGWSITHYLYDDLGRLIETTDNQGHKQTIEYDDEHQRIIQTDANGLQTLKIYDKSGLLISVMKLNPTTSYGTTTHKYDAAGRLIAETDANGLTTYRFYNHLGQLQGLVNTLGQVTEYRYNSDGLLIQTHQYQQTLSTAQWLEVIPDWEEVKPNATKQDRLDQIIYNQYNQIAYRINSEGAVIGYQYNARGQLIASTAYAQRLKDYNPELVLSFDEVKISTHLADRTIRYYYDSEEQLQATIDGSGCAIEYFYDQLGNVIEVHKYAKPQNKALTGNWLIDKPDALILKDIHIYSFYDARGLKIAEIDGEGYATEYRYNERGLLTELCVYAEKITLTIDRDKSFDMYRPKSTANDHQTVYQYNDLNQVISERKQNGLITRYTYDEMGQVISKSLIDEKTAKIRQQHYRYDVMGRITQSLDELGAALLNNTSLSDEEIEAIWQSHSISYEYNVAGLLISKTNALGQKTRYVYDEYARLHYTINADGAVEEIQYTVFNQIESVKKYSNKLNIDFTNLTLNELKIQIEALANPKQDELTRFEYNTLGQVISKHTGSGGLITSEYNAFGELSQTTQKIDAQHNRVTQYQYNKRGHVATITDDAGGISKTKTMTYDALGFLYSQKDARGTIRYFFFNKRGEEIKVYRESTPSNGYYKKISYDAFGRVLEETNYNYGTVINKYSYDDVNGTMTLTQDRSVITTQFDAFGDKVSVTDGNGFETQYEFDDKGQLIHVKAPEGHEKKYTYDALGQLTLEVHSGGYSVSYTYDASGHVLTQIKDPEGAKIKTTYSYDGAGRQLSITDPMGMKKTFTYDAEGHLIQSCMDAEGLKQTTTYAYDERGLLIRQTELNPKGVNKVTAYEWDALGRSSAVIQDPDNLKLTTRYQYDKNDNLISTTDANGHITRYVYDVDNQRRYQIDARGVVTEYQYNNATGSLKCSVTYTQKLNLLAEYTLETVKASLKPDESHDRYQFFYYDNYGYLTGSADGLGFYTSYIYDANNNVICKKMYEQACSLTDLKNGIQPKPSTDKARIEHMLYDGANQLRYKWADNKVTESRYDEAGRLISTTRYAKDLTKEPTDIESLQKLLKTSTEDRTTCYAYDNLGQLVKELSPQGVAKSYQYDALGHLISSTQYASLFQYAEPFDISQVTFTTNTKDRTTHYLYDAAGREVYRISSEGRVIERRYDEAGNVVQELHHSTLYQASIYTLDALQKAMEEQESKATSTEYQYDALGRLIDKSQNKKLQQHYEYDAQGNMISKKEANGAVWTYTYDEANQLIETKSPQVLINGAKTQIITRTTYDSFGNVTTVIRDAEGMKQTVNYEYDLKNQKTKTIYPNVQVNQASAKASSQRTETKKELCEQLQYNAFGQIIASSDKANHWTYSFYDPSGRLSYSLNTQGAVTSYTYNNFNEVTSKTRYATKIPLSSTYTIDSLQTALKTGATDRTEEYIYDLEGRVVELSQKATRSYNPKTGLYDSTLKPTTKTTYNTFGEVTKVSVKLNQTEWADTFYYYDNDGKKSAQIDAGKYLTTYSYDAQGYMISTKEYAEAVKKNDTSSYELPKANTKDRTVLFTYNELGQMTSKTLKGIQVGKKDAKGGYTYESKDLTTTYSYDAMGHLTKTVDPQGNTAYCYYNELGQVIAKVAPKTQDGRAATTYSYDALGNLIETRKWADGATDASETSFKLKGASIQDQITKQIYDNQGHLTQQTDALNHSLYYSYDENGNLARSWQTFTQENATQLQDKQYTYDSENHLIQTKTFKTTDTFKTEDAQYNTFGELTAKGVNGAYTTHVDYDTQGRIWRSNTQGYYQIFVYDLTDQVTQIVTASNGHIQDPAVFADLSSDYYENAISFDQDKLQWNLQRQNNIYDALGHLLIQSKESSVYRNSKLSLQKRTEQQTVDRWGNLLEFVNNQGYKTLYDYNGCNQLIKQELPTVSVMDEKGIKKQVAPINYYYYDELGRSIAMTDANGHTVSKEYDATSHLIKETDAKGAIRQKHYNLLEQVSSQTNELGKITTYTYDKENRLLDVHTSGTQQHYVYNELGQLVQQISGAKGEQETSKFWYDWQGNQSKKQNTAGKETSYEYDDLGHKTKETDALTKTQTWKYNSKGQLEEHTDLGGHKYNYKYNHNGLLQRETSTAGKNISYSHQGNGDLEEYSDLANQETIRFDYNADSQLISRSSDRGGDKKGWNPEIDHYIYDALGRVTQFTRVRNTPIDKDVPAPNKTLLTIDTDYDAVGNIRHNKVKANYSGYETSEKNEYFLYDENDRMLVNKGTLENGKINISKTQGSSLNYDAAGNITTATKYENSISHSYKYEYTDENHLKIVQRDNVSIQAKRYDSLGRVTQENAFDAKGALSQQNIMIYKEGVLKSQSMKDKDNKEKSLITYEYDAAGNLTDTKLTVNDQGNQKGYKLNHHYTYTLWDNYQQEEDQATKIISGKDYKGKSKRAYDVNGLISESVDTQADENGYTNTIRYWNSALDGIKARFDDKGKTFYLSSGNKTIGDLRLNTIANNQEMTLFSGFTPQGSADKTGAANNSSQYLNRTDESTNGTPPESTQDNIGAYTLQPGDSLESIAFQVYGDSSLWYLIADANGIHCSKTEAAQTNGTLQIGQRLTIPPVATGQHHTSATRKILSGEYMLGNTTATTKNPPPPPPPPQAKQKNRIWQKIVVGIVATVATALTAGIAGAMLGMAGANIFAIGASVLAGEMGSFLGTLAVGFTAGFVGNLASQNVASALKLQDGVSLKGAFISGLITAATAGTLRGLSGFNKALETSLGPLKVNNYFNLTTATETIEQNVASQGISMLAHQQKHFEWEQFGAATFTSGILGGGMGTKLQNTLRKIDFGMGFINSEAKTLFKAGINTTVAGGSFNAVDIVADNIGNALGDIAVEGMTGNKPLELELTTAAGREGSKKTTDNLSSEATSGKVIENKKNHTKGKEKIEKENDNPYLFSSTQELEDTLNENHDTNINLEKFHSFEGEPKLHGDLPMETIRNKNGKIIGEKPAGKSGITFATGFDVGQRTKAVLRALKFSPNLEMKLMPFAGKKTKDALKVLAAAKATILTHEEVNEINYKIISGFIKQTKSSWNSLKEKDTPKFEELSRAQQTVVLSRTYQLGSLSKADKFYQPALKNNWLTAEKNLRNYVTKPVWFVNRVQKEANYLKEESGG